MRYTMMIAVMFAASHRAKSCRAIADDMPRAAPKAVLKMEDGSSVRVTVDTAEIELATKYGKLTIPIRDISKVEFAHRIPADKQSIIATSIANLGHASFKVREKAQADLIAQGVHSWLSLQKLAHGKDMEEMKRASTALRAIEDRLGGAPKLLDEDVVYAGDSYRGRLLTEKVAVTSRHFGKQELPLSEIRSYSTFGQEPLSFELEALGFGTKYGTWYDSGFTVDGRAVVNARWIYGRSK